MSDLRVPLALKARLQRTWSAFFSRYGNFTATQLAAIPALLDGDAIMLCAPTASGKTEAVIAPLVERLIPAEYPGDALSIVYITPTKALVNDLWYRLDLPLSSLRISIGIKTGDTSTIKRGHPPAVLICTPESLDSLLTSQPEIFATLRAVILDELHLFDGTPRGDQLRVLLNRIRHIRTYAAKAGAATETDIQFAALSASLPQPDLTAGRYFDNAQVIEVGGVRPVDAELIALSPDSSDEILTYIDGFRAHGWRKALAFCNTRVEVERYAAAVRERSPFGDAVFVHYSNLDHKRRREIEQRFSGSEVAICFASSTLELGIDIGSIDVILLIGAPGSNASFIQRIGRGNRRQARVQTACFYRSALEKFIFEALLKNLNQPFTSSNPSVFRSSVAIQQIFSLIKQSPNGAIRLAPLLSYFDGMITDQELDVLVGHLTDLNYLEPGRTGEWKAGARLHQFIDQQTSRYTSMSLHSNIKSSDSPKIELRDRYSQEKLASVDAQWLDREIVTFEGRPVRIEWTDGEALLIGASADSGISEKLRYRSARQVLSYDLAQQLAPILGITSDDAPFVRTESGVWWFHWLGEIYGQALHTLLRGHVGLVQPMQHSLYLRVDTTFNLPAWTLQDVLHYLESDYRQVEPLLDLGAYHHLLPTHIRRYTVIEQFDMPRFLSAVHRLKLINADEDQAARLLELV